MMGTKIMPKSGDSGGSPEAPAAADTVGLNEGYLHGRLGPSVRVVRNLLVARVGAAFAEFGLRPGAFSMMTLIAANEGCSQNDLARATAMDKSAVVAILDDLEAKGLATRVRSERDRRRHHLSLTREGEKLRRAMQRAADVVEEPIVRELSSSEIGHLLSLLERVRRVLE